MWLFALFFAIAFACNAHSQVGLPDAFVNVDSIQAKAPDSNEVVFVEVLNAMRTNPKSFLPALDRYERYVKSFTPNKTKLSVALREIRARLKKQAPLLPLAISDALQAAADDHVGDLSRSGLMSHFGSDGSNPGTRVKKYGSYQMIGECITIGYLTPDLMVASMLVDEGTPDRGHRESLLKTTFTHVGVGIADHPSLRIATVVVLGAN